MSSLITDKIPELQLIPTQIQSYKKPTLNKQDFITNYDRFLSSQEQQALTYLNKKSNDIHQQKSKAKEIENMSIKEIFNTWSEKHYEILDEVTQHANDLKKYIKPNNESWYNKYMVFLKKCLNTVLKNERMFYFGITVVLVGLLANFIIVSS